MVLAPKVWLPEANVGHWSIWVKPSSITDKVSMIEIWVLKAVLTATNKTLSHLWRWNWWLIAVWTTGYPVPQHSLEIFCDDHYDVWTKNLRIG